MYKNTKEREERNVIEKFLKRSSWTDIVISLIFVFFGVLLIAKPNETVGAISIILGVVFIAMGVLKLVEYYTAETKEDYLLTIALIAVIFGIIILFASDAILSLFRSRVPLLPKLRGDFAEFLSESCLAHLSIFYQPTCGGLRYGYRIISIAKIFLAVWIQQLRVRRLSSSRLSL